MSTAFRDATLFIGGKEIAQVHDVSYRITDDPRPVEPIPRTFICTFETTMPITLCYEGEVDEYKHCLRCRAMYDALQKKCQAASDGEECAALSLNCGHEYKEKWGEDPPPELAELAFLLPGEKPGALIQREVPSV